MNRKDIIRMAREAGIPPVEITSAQPVLYPAPDAIERFARLVAAAEREECAKVCDDMEAGAEFTECCKWPTPTDCAAAIRKRGET